MTTPVDSAPSEGEHGTTVMIGAALLALVAVAIGVGVLVAYTLSTFQAPVTLAVDADDAIARLRVQGWSVECADPNGLVLHDARKTARESNANPWVPGALHCKAQQDDLAIDIAIAAGAPSEVGPLYLGCHAVHGRGDATDEHVSQCEVLLHDVVAVHAAPVTETISLRDELFPAPAAIAELGHATPAIRHQALSKRLLDQGWQLEPFVSDASPLVVATQGDRVLHIAFTKSPGTPSGIAQPEHAPTLRPAPWNHNEQTFASPGPFIASSSDGTWTATVQINDVYLARSIALRISEPARPQ